MNVSSLVVRLAALVFCVVAVVEPATALDANTAFGDFAVDRWTVDNGLPQLSVLSITQDRLGYLWIGTQNGIARFDGQKFDNFTRSNTQGIDTTDAATSLCDSSGRLWFGTSHGVLLYEEGRFRAVPADVPVGTVFGVAEERDAGMLFATANGVLRYADGRLRPARIAGGAPAYSLLHEGAATWIGSTGRLIRRDLDGETAFALPRAAAGAKVLRLVLNREVLWIGTDLGLFRMRSGEPIEPVALAGGAAASSGFGLDGLSIESLFADRDGNVWIGTASALFRRVPSGALTRVRDEDFVRNAYVVSMFEDREGNLWLGSRTESLFRLWNGWARLIGQREGLADQLIWSVARDPAGRITFGSNSNVMRLDADGLREIIPTKALPNPAAYELAYDARGRLWVGTRAGLAVFDDGRDVTPAAFALLAPLQINVILPDAGDADSAWIGTHGGLFRWANGELNRVGTDAGGAESRVRAIHVQADGTVLIGTESGVRRVRGGRVERPAWALPLEGVFVSSIAPIKPGLLGITTRDAGIGLLYGNDLTMLTINDGLPSANSWSMRVIGAQLYVTSIDGVWRAPVAELPDPATPKPWRLTTEIVVGRHSGSQHMHCCNGGASARSLVDGDGLWLPAIQGAIRIDTTAIAPPRMRPTAIVEGVQHAQRWLPGDRAIEIDDGRRDIELQFTGINFRDPKNLHFRYKLEGYDQEWQEAGTRRSAFYTNLPPGRFKFRVQARLSDAVVGGEDATLALHLVARWYERGDVRALAALLVLAFALVGFWHWRDSHLRRGLALEALVAQRTGELERANVLEHEANQALSHAISQLRSEINDRLSAERTLSQRNVELEALNRKLEGAQNQLLQSEKMASVGQLAAGVAHEINNPIGFVQSNMGSLRDYVNELFALIGAYERLEASLPGDDARLRELRALRARIDVAFLRDDVASLLAESADGVGRVVKIVRDLKDFSHVDESEWQVADLHEGLESTLNVVSHELKYKAELVREYGNLPPIACLPFQLNQVFLNLFINAAQAMDERGKIIVRTGCDDGEAWVQIADTGRGIEPAHLHRIFEPFFTTKPVGQGTGLGLSVSYSIVQKHGGRIEVSSARGRGTCFTIRLPMRGLDEEPVVMERAA